MSWAARSRDSSALTASALRSFGEGGRWSRASATISTAGAALQRRKDQLATLETEFLATFAKNSGGVDGSSSPGTKF